MTIKKTKQAAESFDVIVAGAGPAGLAFALSLAAHKIRVALVEKQAQPQLESPAYDGREIALTHNSERILSDLGVWQNLQKAKTISPILQAAVENGVSRFSLGFDTQGTGCDALGYFVPNSEIRRAVYQQACKNKYITLITEAEVVALEREANQATFILADGRHLTAPLAVAADSRFSQVRQMAGIKASRHDFNRTVIVAKLKAELPNQHIAYECFHYERTLAMLSLNDDYVSAVITLPSADAAGVLALSAEEFAADVAARFGTDRLGALQLVSDRYAYPLVGMYAHRFTDHRFALVGDAAVGMHPVTAHGYNLGLQGQEVLARLVIEAKQQGLDYGAADYLGAYHRQHWAASRSLYLGTNALVKLYTDERPLAKIARGGLLRLASRLAPARKRIINLLTETNLARSG